MKDSIIKLTNIVKKVILHHLEETKNDHEIDLVEW
jgi:hypothetical protein